MTRYLPLLLFVGFLGFSDEICVSQSLPIKSARTIQFETEEGSYMNVDVSPDGRTLLFDLLGDLYSVPATGGNATQLTRGIALHLRPVWSPDGSRFAYISDESGSMQLSVRNLSGTYHHIFRMPKRWLFEGSDAIWMTGSRKIAVGGMIYDLRSGKILSRMATDYLVRFSSDGKQVLSLDSGRIYRSEPATKSRVAVSGILKGLYNGILSPDARWWCYIDFSKGRKRLMLQQLTNDSAREIVASLDDGDPNYPSAVPARHYSFSPDSRSIYIAYSGKIHRIDVESKVDQIVPFFANVNADLGCQDYNRFKILRDSLKVKYTRSANLSCDGKHLVFYAVGGVYVMDIRTGKTRMAAFQSFRQYQPVYSPDGRWIAYVSWCDTTGGFLWRVPATGGRPERLTRVAGEYQHPSWSPDGRSIVVIRGKPKLGDRDDPGVGTLLLVQDGEERAIQDSVPLWNHPTFSMDGNRIFFTPKRRQAMASGSEPPQLVSTDLQGRDLRVVAVGTQLTALCDKVLSPDGKFMAMSVGEDIYLASVKGRNTPVMLSRENRKIEGINLGPGMDPYWGLGGQVLYWSYGNRFYNLNIDQIDRVANAVTGKTTIRGKCVSTMNVTVPRFYSKATIALTNVRIITMKGSKVVEHGAIVLRAGRISDVGPQDSIRVPDDARVLDLNGATVMPGLIDVHLHMRVPTGILPEQSWMFLINLAYGVTTARDPSLSFDSFGYSEMLETGQMIGPRLFTVGRAVRLDNYVVRVDGLSDARSVVAKRRVLGGTTIKQYLLPTRIQRQWLLMAAEASGLNMTNEGGQSPIFQLGMIKDGSTGLEHNPLWGDVYDDVIRFIAQSGVYFTPTLQVCYGQQSAKEYFDYTYWRRPSLKLLRFTPGTPEGPGIANGAESIETIIGAHPRDSLLPGFLIPAGIDARILRAGGRLCMGSHGNDEGIGPHNEIWAMQMGGITNMEALQSATIRGAEALGVQRDIGSIEVGKIADLLILNKNPLDDIHNTREIRYVMKDGILYDGDTLDILWPDVTPCPAWKMK